MSSIILDTIKPTSLLDIIGDVSVSSSTASTSTTTGALVLDGGLGIGGKTYSGGGITIDGDDTAFVVDALSNGRLGIVKKAGEGPFFSIGSAHVYDWRIADETTIENVTTTTYTSLAAMNNLGQFDLFSINKIGDNPFVISESTLNVGGDIVLYNNVSNTIGFAEYGVGAPTFSTRSLGTKLLFRSALGVSSADYALGIESNSIWNSVPQASSTFHHYWYGGTTRLMDLRGDGILNLPSTTASTSSTTGIITTAGGISSSNTTDATSSTNGGTFTTAGGAAVAKKLFVGTDTNLATVSGITTIGSSTAATVSAAGLLTVNNTTASTSTTTGALVVAGGAGIDGDFYAATGNISSLLVVGGGAGIAGKSYHGGGISIDGDNVALVVDALSNGRLGIVKKAGEGPYFAIGNGYVYDWRVADISSIEDVPVTTYTSIASLNASGVFNTVGTTASTSSTTGIITTAGGISSSNTTDATSSTNGGTFTTAGGAAVAKKLFVGTDTNLATTSGITTIGSSTAATVSAAGLLTVNNTTASTSTTTGALVVAGGAGIAGSLYANSGNFVSLTAPHSGLTGLLNDDHTQYMLLAGRTGGQILTGGTAASNNLTLRSTTNGTKGQVIVDETTASTSTSTGSLVVGGGIGIGGKTYSGGGITIDADDTAFTIDALSNGRLGIVKKAGVGPYFAIGSAHEYQWRVADTTTMENVATTTYTNLASLTAAGVFNTTGTTASTSSTTGIITTAGGISSSNTTDATSSTNGGSMTLAGGAAVAKKLFVGTDTNLATTSGITTIGSSSPVTVSATGILRVQNTTDSTSSSTGSLVVDGGLGIAQSVFIGTKNITPNIGDITSQITFTGVESASFANVTGLSFNTANTRSFEVLLSVVVVATGSLYAQFKLQGIYNGTSWYFSSSYLGDDTLVTFAITNGGQVTYSSSTYAGFSSLTINFKANTLNI